MTDGRKFMEIGDRLDAPFFIPRVGDKVEFHSDRQTEKGPSAGSIIAVDRDQKTATIRHSDHPGETFSWGDVKVEYFSIAHDGRPFWMLS
jgi:hypothetical protein